VHTYIGISENGPRINNGIAAHTKWNRRLKNPGKSGENMKGREGKGNM